MQSDHTIHSLIQTRGIKANRQREFSVRLTGYRWYNLLAVLERRAEECHHFIEIAEYVQHALDIRRQLKTQGF